MQDTKLNGREKPTDNVRDVKAIRETAGGSASWVINAIWVGIGASSGG